MDRLTTTEWGLRTKWGEVISCNDERHARALMRSTSIVLGPMDGRSVVSREVSDWKAADE